MQANDEANGGKNPLITLTRSPFQGEQLKAVSGKKQVQPRVIHGGGAISMTFSCLAKGMSDLPAKIEQPEDGDTVPVSSDALKQHQRDVAFLLK